MPRQMLLRGTLNGEWRCVSAEICTRDDRGVLLQGCDTCVCLQPDFPSVNHVRVIIANCCHYPYEGLAQLASYGVHAIALSFTCWFVTSEGPRLNPSVIYWNCLMKVTQAREWLFSEHFSAPHQLLYPASAGVVRSRTKGFSCSPNVQWHCSATWNFLLLTVMLWACGGLSDKFEVVQMFITCIGSSRCANIYNIIWFIPSNTSSMLFSLKSGYMFRHKCHHQA
jgi:hypothetical protein